ncbi:PstS family phosphate ABC transporter substrate-binding protein [Paenibacillus sp. J2TS4]|uniref:PstS family phosphate ABC transporter substrate-binding protein n=1 Tax=Paenibacillus sp. J2TS4 TaxID=2807194 RepID=UPI001B057272|nr:substrate-binding domain-containing protein [Paenibacillus sp. J2TS4]GIP33406.1 hypothetical protein J2TS4_26160 [Paenibacillus sp. J2TS4]
MGHILLILLFYCGVIPFIVSLTALSWATFEINFTIAAAATLFICGIFAGIFAAKGRQLPDTPAMRYGPVIFPLTYTAVLWSVLMLTSGGFYGSPVWGWYVLLQLPFLPINFIGSFIKPGIVYLLAPLSYNLSFLICFFLTERNRTSKVAIPRYASLGFLVILILALGVGGAVQWQRSQTVLPSYGFKYGGGYSSTDLWPYDITNPDNQLPRLAGPATFQIDNPKDMPVLDGAEAAFPVYSAFAQAAYDRVGMGESNEKLITFTNTIYAYERLLNREVDIYFGAEPSAEQLKMAEEHGRELIMTPIGKEAFVFFVNPNNPIESLQVSEIKEIYSGKIQNWKHVGGADDKIVAFQRPKNSGSQTLLEKIMGDTPIMTPLKEEVPRGMGGILEQVADYRNYENALGFSFRFFATGMNQKINIKFLAIDGVEPDADNISSGAYPFTATLYAITLRDNSKTTIAPFLEWMQGPQGQQLVEEIGYVRWSSDG